MQHSKQLGGRFGLVGQRTYKHLTFKKSPKITNRTRRVTVEKLWAHVLPELQRETDRLPSLTIEFLDVVLNSFVRLGGVKGPVTVRRICKVGIGKAPAHVSTTGLHLTLTGFRQSRNRRTKREPESEEFPLYPFSWFFHVSRSMLVDK